MILNLLFVFYNAILGVLLSAPIFATSALYYLLLSVMRFAAVVPKQGRGNQEEGTVAWIGGILIALSVVFGGVIFFSMKHQTATVYGTIPMITIATYTFTKITLAIVSAVRHRGRRSQFVQALHSIRYSEIAVSLLTMQQSMLVTFGDGNDPSTIILNAATGAAVCAFILILGILTLKNNRK